MGFLKFLFYFFVVLFVLRILLRLFGPWLLQRLALRMARKMQEEALRQQNAHQRHYDPHFREEVHINNDVRVHIPREDKKPRKTSTRSNAESVEFEEVN